MLIEGKYIVISTDIWKFLVAWYGADIKIELQYSDIEPDYFCKSNSLIESDVNSKHFHNKPKFLL